MYNDNKEVFSCPAVSGAANRACYSIPSGDWSVVAINDRNEAKFSSHGVGFTANVSPVPFYDKRAGRNRVNIRIHPARSNGTEGCIGLRTNKIQLTRARYLIRNSLRKGVTIRLHVQINE